MENPILQKIRDGMDELFLWSGDTLTPTTKDLFTTLGIDSFAEIYLQSKKYGFAVSAKILADLVKLSFTIYANIENLPIKRKVILPVTNGSYKFIVTSIPEQLRRWTSVSANIKEATNTLLLVSTGDDAHAKIAAQCWLEWVVAEVSILGWARIDIDHEKKTIHIKQDSGSYGSCSNQLVEWMLEEYKNMWYTITINMDHQREFFTLSPQNHDQSSE